MTRRLIFTSFLLTTSQVFALSGNVSDNKGNPISRAKIDVVGKQQTVYSDENGDFEFDSAQVDEIHLQAPGYSHKVLHLHGENQSLLKITLNRTVIEHMDVVGIPLHSSTIEAIQPISVVSGDDLRNKQASTLGETLKNEIGIHSTYFGPVASSPIIRGLDGPRVLITQNGLDVGDASRVGPDHVVATEASTAQQIEILRGPATLIYGSGAIGGVVNIVDDRIPADSDPRGAVSVSHNSVSDEDEVSMAYTGGNDYFAFHVDGFTRESGNYEIPGAAEINSDDGSGILENSASESYGFNAGASVLFDNGHIGISYGELDRINGIPGHEEEHSEEEEGAEEEEIILSDLEQERWGLSSKFQLDNNVISSIATSIAYTEYTHAEIENGEVGTRFNNDSAEIKTDILHQEFYGWRGALSLQFKHSDFEAVGEEAFTSPSETTSFALALTDEKHFDDFLLEVGARVEHVDIDIDDAVINSNDIITNVQFEEFGDFDFTPVSLSVGWIWDYKPAYKVSASFTYAERAPSAAELFSLGPHIATGAYEIGSTFDIVESGGNSTLQFTGDAEEEVSNNIDLSWRKHEGRFGFVFNLFYNEISDFFYQRETGFNVSELGFLSTAGLSVDVLLDEELPVFIYEQDDATFYGIEAEVAFQLATPLKLTVWGDAIRGELDDGGDLPRIPPARLGAQLNFVTSRWSAEISSSTYFDQNDIAENETPTDGYTLVDANVAYHFNVDEGDLSLFLKIDNAFDQEARVHSSFLKDVAPLPGRGLALGMRGSF